MPTNPTISPLLRWVTAFECTVLIVSGAGLFFFPAAISPLWPWPLTPFNARFLGAVYLGSLVSALLLVIYGRWTPARIVIPMILSFTLIVLVVSLININRFTVPLSTLFWFALYIIIPLNAAYHQWLYRRLPPAPALELTSGLRLALRIQTLILGLYGVALLIAPATFGAFWPWPLDDFHGRMYSVAFITPAVGGWLLARSATRTDLRTLGLTGLTAGSLAIVGLLIVNAIVPVERQINPTLAGTWLWLGLFASMVLAGLAMLWASFRKL